MRQLATSAQEMVQSCGTSAGSAFDDVQLRLTGLRASFEPLEDEDETAATAGGDIEEGSDEHDGESTQTGEPASKRAKWFDRDRAVAAALRKDH
eukprot:6491404-Amphidinium_carterae.2